jgi:hypothetical protein
MDIQIELVVRRGPFRGLKYPQASSVGSSLIPKLLGTYELELEGLIEKLCLQPYTEIVDIGCAEGFYANGFAVRHPQALIYAYDTDPSARDLCRQMSRLNNVEHQVKIASECNPFEIVNLPYRGKALIFCDCEGYEKQLFNDDTLGLLKHHDFLIETHDLFDIEISTFLEEKFKHHGYSVQRIESIDDLKKARTYDIPEIKHLSLIEKFQLLRENRMRIMDWLFCTKLTR